MSSRRAFIKSALGFAAAVPFVGLVERRVNTKMRKGPFAIKYSAAEYKGDFVWRNIDPPARFGIKDGKYFRVVFPNGG